MTPRTGDLLAPGEVGGGASYTVFSYAPGEVTLADGDTAGGNSAQRGILHPIAYLTPHVPNTQGSLRVGLTRGVELGFTLGLQQLGGELRFGVSDEDAGDPVSSAVGLAAMWRPFAAADGPWLALSLDTSRRFGARTLLVDLSLSYGPEDHAMGLEPHQERECGGFGDDGCGEYSPPRQFAISRPELRASAAVGVGFGYGDEGGAVVLSVVPYLIAWANPDGAVYDCVGCSYLDPVALDESWGAHLVVGLQFNGVTQ